MKKYILFLIPFLFWGCQKDFNNVVDIAGTNSVSELQVKGVETADSFTYSTSDSLLTISIALTSSKDVSEVYCDIYSSDGNKINSGPFQLFDNGFITQNGDTVAGDFTYSNKFPLSSSYIAGNYEIQYFITSTSGTSKLIAVHYFQYTAGKPNVAPVISNLVAPSSATIGSSDVTMLITLDVHDDNGPNDIQSVYFNSYIPPSGSPSSNNPYYLNDSGQNGDAVAGDGTYSITIVLPSTGVTKGTYRWEFFAKDRSGAVSNKITHNIEIQ